jgi:hypothetical protein
LANTNSTSYSRGDVWLVLYYLGAVLVGMKPARGA